MNYVDRLIDKSYVYFYKEVSKPQDVKSQWVWFWVAFLAIAAWLFCSYRGYARWTASWSWTGVSIGCK